MPQHRKVASFGQAHPDARHVPFAFQIPALQQPADLALIYPTPAPGLQSSSASLSLHGADGELHEIYGNLAAPNQGTQEYRLDVGSGWPDVLQQIDTGVLRGVVYGDATVVHIRLALRGGGNGTPDSFSASQDSGSVPSLENNRKFHCGLPPKHIPFYSFFTF